MAMITVSAPGRAAHVLVRFLPMVLLGLLFLVIGLTTSPHYGIIPVGSLFAFIGAILIIGAILGMVFTRCELDYVRWRVMCFHEPDVMWDSRYGDYYRELVPDETFQQ
ncbi:MAG TPA: hypothetical protein VMG36_05650 [Thermoplasmata archaeon]|nr:hypothetical protein [Thermoplasmata archaeon]